MKSTSFVRRQLWAFVIIAVVAVTVTAVVYARIPDYLGIGRYHVTIELADGAGLYTNANVTYRGSAVGKVTDLKLTSAGATATVLLDSSHEVPADLDAAVHSMSAIGEQYIDLLPRRGGAPYLAEGSVISRSRTSVPVATAPTIDDLARTLQSVSSDKLRSVLDESFTAVGGTGSDLATLLDSLHGLTETARENQEPTKTLIDQLGPLLDSQVASGNSITAWASSLATVTDRVKASDGNIRDIIDKGAPFADQVTGLFQDLRPTLPLLLANMTSVEQVAAVYNSALEQILVLYPPLIAATQSAGLPNAEDPGQNTFFAAQLNDPPPCTDGFLPASQRRSPELTDVPPTPTDLYCKVAPDDATAIRGARNLPCIEFPGRRAATVQLCRNPDGESPPTATPASLTGPVASTGTYDPSSGTYIAGDGRTYTDIGLKPGGRATSVASLLVPGP